MLKVSDTIDVLIAILLCDLWTDIAMCYNLCTVCAIVLRVMYFYSAVVILTVSTAFCTAEIKRT